MKNSHYNIKVNKPNKSKKKYYNKYNFKQNFYFYKNKSLFLKSMNIGRVDGGILNFLKFTAMQLLKYNVQLGAPKRLVLSTSIWFILGIRLKFSIIDIVWSIFFLKKILVIIYGVLMNRKHMCIITDYAHVNYYFENTVGIVGEGYFSGQWIGGSLTNYKHIRSTCSKLLFKVHKYGLDSLSIREYRLYKSLNGIRNFVSMPGVVLLNSAKRNIIASKEARAMWLSTFSLTDSDSISKNSLYPLVSNDDSISAFYFFSQILLKSALLSKINNVLDLKKKKLFFLKKFKSKFRFLRDFKKYIILKLFLKLKRFFKSAFKTKRKKKVNFKNFFFFFKKLKWRFKLFLLEIFKKYFYFNRKLFFHKTGINRIGNFYNIYKNKKKFFKDKKSILYKKYNDIFKKKNKKRRWYSRSRKRNFFNKDKKSIFKKKYNFFLKKSKIKFFYENKKKFFKDKKSIFFKKHNDIFKKKNKKRRWYFRNKRRNYFNKNKKKRWFHKNKRKNFFYKNKKKFLKKKRVVKGYWYNPKFNFFRKRMYIIRHFFKKKPYYKNNIKSRKKSKFLIKTYKDYKAITNSFLDKKKSVKEQKFLKFIFLKKKFQLNITRYKLLKFKKLYKKLLSKKIIYKYNFRKYNYIS